MRENIIKMKSRMSSVDIRAEVKELQSLVGLRLSNIYDLTPKLFILKLSRPDFKAHLLFEPGIRLHTTSFAREKPAAPSPFTSKLRKFLRTRRLIKIEQLGIDRVVDFAFTSGEDTFHIILELYAQGNLLFTDQNYLILALLRSHKFEEDVKYAKGEIYPFTHAAGLTFVDEINKEELRERIKNYMEGQEKNKKGVTLKQLLAGIEPYMHFPLAEHCLKAAGCTSVNKKITSIDFELIEKAVVVAHSVVRDIDEGNFQGYLAYESKEEKKTYFEFSPVMFSQFPQDSTEINTSFDKAVDLFFSVVEKQKSDVNQEKQEQEIWKKRNRIEEDQERRLNGLKEEQITSVQKANIIQSYIFELDNLFNILKNCLSTGVNWDELLRMIIEEKNRGNPYAALVKKLKLEKNIVVVNLKDPETEEVFAIEVDITKNAFQNAREYFENKKASAIKEVKTKDHIQKAIKEAEKKAKIELQKQQMKLGTGVRVIRKVYWWEKFNWFISSENYLIISGKDAQQNEMIVKKYMKKGDIYVHADMHGASSTVIKNPSGLPIPQKTLEEAGTYCVCLSSAWSNKIIQSAWWVHSNQVSKTAPTGLYLSLGSFMIRGKKNFLHPSKLEMSIVLLFKLDEGSIANHVGERNTQEIINNPEVEENKNEISVGADEEWTISESVFDKKTQKSDKKQKTAKQEKNDKKKQDEKDQKSGKKNQKGKKEEEKKDIEEEKIEKNKPLTAHQAKKLKKIKEKYGEQTEEEKQARLKLLGSKEVKFSHLLKNEVSENISLTSETSKPEESIEKVPEFISNLSEIKQVKYSDEDSSEENEEKSSDEEDKQNSTQEKKDKQEIQNILDDENLLGEEELKALGETDSLTGQPRNEDLLIFCLPMCAPHIATNSYKYRIKLVPGNLKKGKALSLITHTWLNGEAISENERNLIKSMNETDLITVLPGKVSIASAAAKKIQQSGKKNKN